MRSVGKERSLTLPLLRQQCGGDQRKATRLPLEGLGLEDLEALKLLPRPEVVRELLATDNALRGLEEVRPLAGLRRLLVGKNRLETVAGIEGCVALEELDLSDNAVDGLRLAALAALPRLAVLSVAGVPGATLPRALLGRGTLTRLSLARCGLRALPSLAPLRLLERLDVADNLLPSLAGTAGLPRLRHLWAARNLLREARLEALPALQELDLRGNPLLAETPRREGLTVLRDEPRQEGEREPEDADKSKGKSKKKKTKKKTKKQQKQQKQLDGSAKGGKQKKRKVLVDEQVVEKALGAEEAVDRW